MDLINGFVRASLDFGWDLPTRSGQARGSLHLSGIRASRIRFGPANSVGPKRGATLSINLNHSIWMSETQLMAQIPKLYQTEPEFAKKTKPHFELFLGPMGSKFEYTYFKEICSPRSLFSPEI